ncbi:MAG TPA: hypothetical protein VGM06_16610 [Polyangiaceae bacterium]
MTATGDLIIYNSLNNGVYHSATSGHPGIYVAINDSGDVQLCTPAGVPFSTNPTMHLL